MNWTDIASKVSAAVDALAPLAEALVPEAAAAVEIGQKIIQGVIDEEPTAIALYNQIVSGTPPSAAQLQQFSSDYEDSYQKLAADIKAKIAALPPS